MYLCKCSTEKWATWSKWWSSQLYPKRNYVNRWDAFSWWVVFFSSISTPHICDTRLLLHDSLLVLNAELSYISLVDILNVAWFFLNHHYYASVKLSSLVTNHNMSYLLKKYKYNSHEQHEESCKSLLLTFWKWQNRGNHTLKLSFSNLFFLQNLALHENCSNSLPSFCSNFSKTSVCLSHRPHSTLPPSQFCFL